MVNKIWGSFIIIGIIFCIINNKIDVLNKVILESGKTSLDMIIKIFPVMALWLGIMNIALLSGLIDKLAKFLYPILRVVFKDIPKNHESLSYIASNIITNVFGLGNASTPFGLKAMKSLQEINPKKDTASRSMITFLVINTSCITLVPTTVISLRMYHNSSNPNEIILACIIATFISLVGGLIIDYMIGRKYR